MEQLQTSILAAFEDAARVRVAEVQRVLDVELSIGGRRCLPVPR